MVMDQDISAMMDGEVDAEQVEAICKRLRSDQAVQTWVCYHVIGDALRGSPGLSPGFVSRLSAKLEDEPTVLAPPPRRQSTPVRTAWAIAASAAAVAVVGWVAMQSFSPPEQPARATLVSTIGKAPALVRRGADVGDYVLVHQEYSPATMIQGVQPYIRAVSAPDGAGR
jgi:sigma-E factor negative regulatory protein RseA